jgi:hypothetical protein
MSKLFASLPRSDQPSLVENISDLNQVFTVLHADAVDVANAVAKGLQFGHWAVLDGTENIVQLEHELGKMLCMIDILVDNHVLLRDNINSARLTRLENLKLYHSHLAKYKKDQ